MSRREIWWCDVMCGETTNSHGISGGDWLLFSITSARRCGGGGGEDTHKKLRPRRTTPLGTVNNYKKEKLKRLWMRDFGWETLGERDPWRTRTARKSAPCVFSPIWCVLGVCGNVNNVRVICYSSLCRYENSPVAGGRGEETEESQVVGLPKRKDFSCFEVFCQCLLLSGWEGKKWSFWPSDLYVPVGLLGEIF